MAIPIKEAKLNKNRHTISLFVANKPGVLVRVSLIFSRRGFNIESLVVSAALDGRFSRMTITAFGDRKTLEQIIKQLAKLVDVVHCEEHTGENVVEKELALIKLNSKAKDRTDILEIITHFKSQTVDLGKESLIVLAVGSTAKIDAMVETLHPYGLVELVRTGKVVMARGGQAT